MGHGDGVVRRITYAATDGVFIDAHDQIDTVDYLSFLAELIHLWKLISRIDVQQRERDFSAESFAGEPDEDVGVFAHGPRHADGAEVGEGLTEDVDGRLFQAREVVVLSVT